MGHSDRLVIADGNFPGWNLWVKMRLPSAVTDMVFRNSGSDPESFPHWILM